MMGSSHPDPSVAVRRAAEPDLPRIQKLLAEAALPTDGVDASLLPATAVITRAGEIIGSASIEVYGQVGLLRSVVIAPEFRSRKFGERLVLERMAWAKTSGITTLALFTEHAAAFFKRLGFLSVTRDLMPAEVHGSFEFGFCPTTSEAMILVLTNNGE